MPCAESGHEVRISLEGRRPGAPVSIGLNPKIFSGGLTVIEQADCSGAGGAHVGERPSARPGLRLDSLIPTEPSEVDLAAPGSDPTPRSAYGAYAELRSPAG